MGGLDHIVDGLLDNDSITDVTLWTPRQYRSEQALAKLADCLRSSPWTSLNLTMNFERTTDVADLGDAIGKSQDLRKLSLVGNSKGLRYFRVMDYLGLRAAGIQALSDGLKKNRSIESLDITDNGVDAQGARVLSYALQGHPSLNRLSLAGNSIGMEGAKITIERLCSNDSRLVIIDLSGNNIGSLSDQIFVPVIESNKTLKELHISENKILDTAMISILQALTVNTTITGFSCARNHMTRAVLPSLETLLMKNKTLLTLDISGNPLEDATHLGKSLAANTTLEFVSIENINFADLSGFCENVKGNRSLQEMEVGALGEDLDLQRHVQPLADMMKAMPRLTALSISGGMQAEEVKQVKEAWLSVSGRVAGSLIMDGVEQLDGDKRTDSDEYDDNEEEEDEQDDADSHDGEEPIEAGDEGAVAAPTV